MSERLAMAFEVCLQALATGASLEACLSLYPDLADELRPALQAAAVLSRKPAAQPAPAAQARSRSQMLAHATRARSQSRWQVLRQPLPRLGLVLMAVMVALVAGWGGLTSAAAQSLPGETLYRVKRADETVRLQLVRDTQARQALRLTFNDRREDEARELIRLGRKGPVSFEGIVEGQAAGQWTISSLPVALSAETQVAGGIGPGDSVIVIGTTRLEGDILASEILLHTYQLVGPVEQQAPSEWVVAGQLLRIVGASQIQEDIHPDDVARVLVEVQPNGDHVALVILSMGSARRPPDRVAPNGQGSPATPPFPASPEADDDQVEFNGIVEDHQGPVWRISGRTLLQTSDSDIRGEIVVGDQVRVHALVSGTGGLILVRIEKNGSDRVDDSESESGEEPSPDDPEATPTPEASVGGDSSGDTEADDPERVHFSGTVTGISSGQWVIAGQTLRITGDSQIDEDLGVGDQAEVRALRYSDGHLEAERIEAAD